MRAAVGLGLVVVVLVGALGARGTDQSPAAAHRGLHTSATSPSVASAPPSPGPALVVLPLAGTQASAPEPADAVAVLQAGVQTATGAPVAVSELAVVGSGADALTCLVKVKVGPTGRPPLLATVRRVDDGWSFVGVQ